MDGTGSLFVYCYDNPIMFVDPSGYAPSWWKKYKENWDAGWEVIAPLGEGGSLYVTGVIAACTAVSILSCGTATPVMVATASVLLAAGVVSSAYGASEMVASYSGENIILDKVMGGDEELYNNVRFIASTTAIAGTITLSPYVKNISNQFSNQSYQPKPPGWNADWEFRYPEGTRPSNKRWFDPYGGEWRWHSPDKWHNTGHWDYNSWETWNSKWKNIFIK